MSALTTFLTIVAGWVIVLSCLGGNYEPAISPQSITIDTIVYSKAITSRELPGGAYRKRGTSYSLILGRDTSDLKCYFTESLKGRVGTIISFAKDRSYSQQFKELQSIFRFASKEYSMDSLGGSFFYLLETGDLAIDVTRQMSAEDIKNVTDNWKTAKFLLTSKLTVDLDNLLVPYNKKVKNYAIEHPMLIDGHYVIKLSRIETPKENIPAKILDGTIWVYFKN